MSASISFFNSELISLHISKIYVLGFLMCILMKPPTWAFNDNAQRNLNIIRKIALNLTSDFKKLADSKKPILGVKAISNMEMRQQSSFIGFDYETKECLCEALIRIFKYIGGVPLRILFDNMSSAVVQIEEHGNRKVTEMFMRFTMHHRFKAEFCNPDSPNEKGNAENKAGYIRRNYLLPPPSIVDLEKYNAELLNRCMEDLKREHYVKGKMISELFTGG